MIKSNYVSNYCNKLMFSQITTLGDYTLHYLSNRVKLAPFVTQALLQVWGGGVGRVLSLVCHQFVARLTKHSWFDSEQETFVFRDIVDQVGNLLRVGVKIT